MSSRVLKLAAALLAGLMLAGCASGNPQVAAYVGDEAIPESRVHDIAQVLTETGSTPAETAVPVVAGLLVQSKLAAKAAIDQGIVVSPQERQSFLDSNPLFGQLVANPVTADFMTEYANAVIVVNSDAGREGFEKVLATTEVKLNPRFGVWDRDQGGIVEGSTGSISRPAGSLEAGQ